MTDLLITSKDSIGMHNYCKLYRFSFTGNGFRQNRYNHLLNNERSPPTDSSYFSAMTQLHFNQTPITDVHPFTAPAVIPFTMNLTRQK